VNEVEAPASHLTDAACRLVIGSYFRIGSLVSRAWRGIERIRADED